MYQPRKIIAKIKWDNTCEALLEINLDKVSGTQRSVKASSVYDLCVPQPRIQAKGIEYVKV